MIEEFKKQAVVRLTAVVLLTAMLFTACASSAQNAAKQLELGRKYLTEMNYSEAVAAFTEAIRLNPKDIQAYIGRAQAYAALEQYEDAKGDYTMVIEKTGELPYTQARAYTARAEINQTLQELVSAELDAGKAITLLGGDDLHAKEQVSEENVTALKKQALRLHIGLCVTLALVDKALADYDQLEQLGEDVAAARDALLDEGENGMETPDNASDTADPGEENGASEKKAAASGQEKEEEPASSKETPAASGADKTEQAASSAASKAEEKSASAGTVSGRCGDNAEWVLDADGTLHISGSGAIWNYDYENAKLWDDCRDRIKTAVIENGITSIGEYAFTRCTAMTSVLIPGSVSSVGQGAFSECNALTSLTLPDAVSAIPMFLCMDCTSLQSVKLPSHATVIGDSSFSGCTALTSVIIPEGVTRIEWGAFNYDTALASVTIPRSVKFIADRTFRDAPLTSVTISSDCVITAKSEDSFPFGTFDNSFAPNVQINYY